MSFMPRTRDFEGLSATPCEAGGVTGPEPTDELVSVWMREGVLDVEGGVEESSADEADDRPPSLFPTTGVMVKPIALRRKERVCWRMGVFDGKASRFSAVLTRGILRLSCLDNRFDLVLPNIEFERKGFSSWL